MSLNKFFITFLIIIFVGLGVYYFDRLGYYPVALVNGTIISARALNEEFDLAYQYYASVMTVSNKTILESPDFHKDLRRAALNDLIEKTLIRQELEKQVGNGLAGAVDEKVGIRAEDKRDLEDAAQALYGVSLAEFTDLVLVPKAYREILGDRLAEEKSSLDNWLAEAVKMANITILTIEFSWDKDKTSVVLR
ncbi:MAG: hypothetical protein UY14_C0035G0008 [Parcubacteria group bacterium GW2011_GWA1_47_9]|nr:MAG: hypothetical protein UY14_C0035G0008 [Parcubacteria group bacterium GW2011_GWA1_47_9]